MHKLLTVKEAKGIFEIANNAYFKGEVPKPRFETFSKYNALAMYTYSWLANKKGIYTIYVSKRYKIDTSEFVNLIAHEMLHIYIHHKYGPTWFVHGKTFKKLAKELNEKHNINIRKTMERDKFSEV